MRRLGVRSCMAISNPSQRSVVFGLRGEGTPRISADIVLLRVECSVCSAGEIKAIGAAPTEWAYVGPTGLPEQSLPEDNGKRQVLYVDTGASCMTTFSRPRTLRQEAVLRVIADPARHPTPKTPYGYEGTVMAVDRLSHPSVPSSGICIL